MREKKIIEEIAKIEGMSFDEAKLSYQSRKNLPKSAFVFPKKAPGGGSYPIHDRRHGANALSRVSAHGTPSEKAAVRKKVCAKYPDLPACKKKECLAKILREYHEIK